MNTFLRALKVDHPIIQAPMAGGGDTPDLVASVSNAGGIGFFGAAYSSPEQIRLYGAAVRSRTTSPFGVNLFAPLDSAAALLPTPDVDAALEALSVYYAELEIEPPLRPELPPYSFDDQLGAALGIGAAALSFTFGMLPEHAVRQVKACGLLLWGTATTVEEAKALARLGVDAIIAQGAEAGGHRGTFLSSVSSSLIGTMALVPQIVDAMAIPVIASGGIMDGRGIAAALSLGAVAVQLGTAFLTTDEAGVPACYKDALLGASEDDLVLTRAFSGRWARGIGNRFTREMETGARSILPFPLQNALTRPIRAAAAKKGDSSMLSLWAGQGLRMARRQSATELVRTLTRQTMEALDRRSALKDSLHSGGTMAHKEQVLAALRCFSDSARRAEYFSLYSEDVVFHGYDGVEPGIESVREYYARFWSAFPDAQIVAEDFVEQDDKLTIRFTVEGTHLGSFGGIAATAKRICLPGVAVLRFANGKCVERWTAIDSSLLLRQLH